jgi:hypothetical protein
MDGAARRLLEDATAASPTVAGLVARLEASDLIVLASVTMVADGIAGDTRLLATTTANRILQIRIDNRRPREEQMGWLGHELQHAAEIAGAPEVRTEAHLVVLLKRIGRSRDGDRLFETDAAVACGRSIHREVADRR